MLKKIVAGLFCLFGLVSLAAIAADKTSSAASKTVVRVEKIQPEFTFKLPANRSTGYSWYLVPYDNNLLQPISQEYVSSGNAPGEGGYDVWTFRAAPEAFAVPYQFTLNFVYARAFEKVPARKMNVTIYTSDF